MKVTGFNIKVGATSLYLSGEEVERSHSSQERAKRSWEIILGLLFSLPTLQIMVKTGCLTIIPDALCSLFFYQFFHISNNNLFFFLGLKSCA